jgi:hypothetical protein
LIYFFRRLMGSDVMNEASSAYEGPTRTLMGSSPLGGLRRHSCWNFWD